MMKKFKKTLALILSILMLMSVFSTGASAYFPYINNGGDAISSEYQITSVNVTDLYGDEVTELAAGEGALVSCKIKAVDGSGQVQLIATAYNSAGKMVAVKRSDVVTLGANAEDIGVYLTAPEAASSFKAFIWDGSADLIPLTKSADSASEAVDVLGVSFNGEAVDKDVTTHNVTLPVYQLDFPSVQILTDNPAARVEVTSDKAFPLTKQHGDAEGSAVVTATITLNGTVVKTYTFNVTQAAPAITNAKLYEWNGGNGTTTVYYNAGDSNQYNADSNEIIKDDSVVLSLEKIAEADYTAEDLGYKRSTIADAARTTAPADGVYFNVNTNGADEYMLYDIPNEFLNGTLFKTVNRSASSKRPFSTYSLSDKSSTSNVASEDTLIPSSQHAAYSFDINRSATVYVYNAPDENYSKTANVQTFINEDFVNKTELVLKYYNFSSGKAVTKGENWYEKHIDVTGETPASVRIPVGAHPMNVIVKFDECEIAVSENVKAFVAENVKYTLTDETVEDTETLRLYEPIPKDDGLVFVGTDNSSYNDYIDKVQPWTTQDFILSGIDEAVLGGEVIRIPNDPVNLKSVSFTLKESADVYFVTNCKSGTQESHWMDVKGDWFESGWRLVPQDASPIDSILYLGASGGGRQNTSWGDTGNEAVKKHFDVSGEPITVTLELADFQNTENIASASQFASESTGTNQERAILVIIKKTDR